MFNKRKTSQNDLRNLKEHFKNRHINNLINIIEYILNIEILN